MHMLSFHHTKRNVEPHSCTSVHFSCDNDIFLSAEGVGERSASIVAAARAVAMQLPREARYPMERCLEAARWVAVDRRRVRLVDPQAFDRELRAVRIDNLDVAIRAAGREAAPRDEKIARLRSAWAPLGDRRFVVSFRSDANPQHRAVTRSDQAELLRE